MICKVCGVDKPEDAFMRTGYYVNGAIKRRSTCKSCKAAWSREYRRRQAEQRRHQAEQEGRLIIRDKSRQERAEMFVLMCLEHQRWPSQKEIARAVRVNIQKAREYLEVMERDGKIIRQPRKHRGLQLAG